MARQDEISIYKQLFPVAAGKAAVKTLVGANNAEFSRDSFNGHNFINTDCDDNLFITLLLQLKKKEELVLITLYQLKGQTLHSYKSIK